MDSTQNQPENKNASASKKVGLGRGLSTLIPQRKERMSTEVAKKPDRSLSSIVEIDISAIEKNPHQPRKEFNDDKLRSLAGSIKVHGIMQPLVVSKKEDNSYQLIAGERRLQASKLVGLKTVPVVIRAVSEQEKLELALIENVQRHNLNPIEEAHAYTVLMNQFNLTQEEIGVRVGKKRSSVANTLRLLSLPDEIKQALSKEVISAGHAKALLSIENAKDQLIYFHRILDAHLSVREAESSIKKKKENKITVKPEKSPDIIALEQKIQEKMGTKAKIRINKKGGEVALSFYSPEDLKEITDSLLS
ncbi:ParB/RepB/Spo0J family partition protein [Patescibacteria group bacterium]|nr:ParB/RepB/Spo0J family partition protein [Patescibacteria group bacterium]